MNRRAKQLGLAHTHFTNSRGTADPGAVLDGARPRPLARYAMRDATFRQIVSTREHGVRYPPDAAVPVHNHNRLLQEYDWADGIKTGSNAASGKVLAAVRQARSRRAHRRHDTPADADRGGPRRRQAVPLGDGRVPAAHGRPGLALGLSHPERRLSA